MRLPQHGPRAVPKPLLFTLEVPSAETTSPALARGSAERAREAGLVCKRRTAPPRGDLSAASHSSLVAEPRGKRRARPGSLCRRPDSARLVPAGRSWRLEAGPPGSWVRRPRRPQPRVRNGARRASEPGPDARAASASVTRRQALTRSRRVSPCPAPRPGPGPRPPFSKRGDRTDPVSARQMGPSVAPPRRQMLFKK